MESEDLVRGMKMSDMTGPKGMSAFEQWEKSGGVGGWQGFMNSLKGPKGDAGAAGSKGDTGAIGATGAKGDVGPRGESGSQGSQGVNGDSRVKFRAVVDVAAQSTGTYTLPAINLGANVFTNKPIVSVDIESSSGVITARYVIAGSAAAGFTVTVTLSAMKSTIDISLGALLGVNLLAASLPALKVHIVGIEP